MAKYEYPLRLSEDEKAALDRICKVWGLTQADMIRELIIREDEKCKRKK